MEADKQTVLLAEDDALVQMTLEEIMGDAGFDFVMVVTGQQAVDALEREPERFCALVTDIRMPGKLTGWDAAHRARELKPSLPVIYMTGDSAQEWRAHGVPDSVLLQKPFVPAQLVTALATLLNEAQTHTIHDPT